MDIQNKHSFKKFNFLIITANVGTLFEKSQEIEEIWLTEFLQTIRYHNAQFIALHCQEIGGKNYKAAFDSTVKFFRKLACWKELKDFKVVQGILDGDVEGVDQFTALGNIYFIHNCIEEAEMFNFQEKKFFKPTTKEILFHNDTHHARKEKFEQDFFPECNWTRKGYFRVRWKIYNKVIEFVNVHLFHDDSNVKAVQNTPSHYTAFRKRGIDFVMKRLAEECPLPQGAALFLLGDFNFRLDVKSLIESLVPSCREKMTSSSPGNSGNVIQVVRSSNDDRTIASDNCAGEVVVRLEKKRFEINSSDFDPIASHHNLRRFDIELPLLNLGFDECDVTFPPTYPYSEEKDEPNRYMTTRCPSWCDRILTAKSTSEWMRSQKTAAGVSYDTIGPSVCMGDHKPVFIAFTAAV